MRWWALCSFAAFVPFQLSFISLSAERLEIQEMYDAGLGTGRSLSPDDFLIKEKHLQNWLLHGWTSLLRKVHLIPSEGSTCMVQVQLLRYVLSLLLLSKAQWSLETLRVYCAFPLPHVPEKINWKLETTDGWSSWRIVLKFSNTLGTSSSWQLKPWAVHLSFLRCQNKAQWWQMSKSRSPLALQTGLGAAVHVLL